MGHVFHMISYVDCDVDCDMDSYMPGGGGMLTTDIEASRWSKPYHTSKKVHLAVTKTRKRLKTFISL